MSRKNYTKYSKMNKEENNEVVLDKTSFEETTIQNNNQSRIDEILEHLTYDMSEEERQAYYAELETLGYKDNTNDDDIPAEIVKDDIKDAVVIDCAKLRIRKAASVNADVYGTIENGTEVTINLTNSTEEFYNVNIVINEALISGYCMKKFIKLK